MDTLSFADFIKHYTDMKNQKKMDFFFPANARFSFPILVRREEKIYDGLFAWLPPENSGEELAYRPFGWLLMALTDGDICLMAECKAADFIATSAYPLTGKVVVKLPEATDKAKVKGYSEQLLAVYEGLRRFAFEENLSREQVAAVVQYKDLFLRLCPKGLYPFYHALSPAFFHWLRLPLPETTVVAAAADKEEPRDFRHQLLILESLQQLSRQFQEKIAVDTHKEKLFDELHQEVQAYKNGVWEDATRPMELDIIRLIDGLSKTIGAFRAEKVTEEAEKILVMLEGVETDLRDVLYRQGIDPYHMPGDTVDVSRQTVVAPVPAENPGQDKKICARLAPGWEKSGQGKVLRPERVTVYLYESK